MKKVLISILCTLGLTCSLSALDMSLRVNPNVIVPQKSMYALSAGALLQYDFALFDLITVGIEAGDSYDTPNKMTSGMNFAFGGIGVGAYYNLFSRMYVGGGAGFGIYGLQFEYENNKKEKVNVSTGDLYYRVYGEVGYRLSPSITVCGNAGYTSFNVNGSNPALSGLSAGVTAKINFSTGKGSKGACYANVNQEGDVYPLFQQVYRFSPVATATIVNGESAEIKNVTVSFRAGKYTSSALKSEVIPVIKKMQTYDVPLVVDFSSELLRFNENGRISGDLVIEYELLGRRKTSVQTISLAVSNRNTYVWGNNDSIAAFISPDTPEILEYAKYVAGVARNDLYTGMNRNIQFAASMFEALRSSGLSYSDDKQTPYTSYHKSSEKDFIQYPLQTMDFASGDLDEIGILYASCLESIGVETAFMPLDNDFLVLVGIGAKPSAAANHFGDVDSLALTEDNVYFALSMAEFSKGFAKSRAQGAKLVAQCNKDEEGYYEFISTRDAWAVYPPAVFTGSGDPLPKPAQLEIQRLTKAALQDYMTTDLAVVIAKAKNSGDVNKLGIAYVRAGRYSEAKAEFTKGANAGNISAINNLANVYFMEKNYVAAAAQYKRVLLIDPENKTAKKGLENTNSKISN